MALKVTSSRFACLVDDDETNWTPSSSKSKNKKKNTNDEGKAKKKNQQPSKNNQDDLRSLAFGGSKKKKGGGGGGQKKNANGSSGVDPTNNVDQKDFKDWADRDGERVRQEYESDLKDALLQSKISFEETKQVPPLPTGDGSQQSSSLTNGHDKKKKKAAAISLDEFNSLPSDRLQNLHLNGSAPPGPPGVSGGPFSPFGSGFGRSPEKDIFDQVAEDARKVLEREKRLEILQRSARVSPNDAVLPLPPPSQHPPTLSKEERFEILVLKKENTELKDELQTTKDRNKKLLAILTHGEMKEKAKLILEAEKLTAVRDELTAEVTRLTAEMEQHKNTAHELTKALRKYQGKRQSTSGDGN